MYLACLTTGNDSQILVLLDIYCAQIYTNDVRSYPGGSIFASNAYTYISDFCHVNCICSKGHARYIR